MFRDLRRFLTQRAVVKLTVAVALGFAVAHLAETAVNGLVALPIRTSDYPTLGHSDGSVAIFGRVFDWLDPLMALLVVIVVLALVVLVLSLDRDELRGDSLSDCPHCLSPVPAEAEVCSHCGRDIDPAPATGTPALA